MTEQEYKDHSDWYKSIFGYRELTLERARRKGALTTQSKW